MNVPQSEISQSDIRNGYYIKEGVRFQQEIGKRGLAAVLVERGAITDLKKHPITGKKWLRCQMVEELQSHPDFQEDVDKTLADKVPIKHTHTGKTYKFAVVC